MKRLILFTLMIISFLSFAAPLKMTNEPFTTQNIKIFGDPEVKYVSPDEVYVNGVRLKQTPGEDTDIVNETIRGNNSNETSKMRPREATIQCSHHSNNGGTYYLTQVSGGGAPSTYWITFVAPDGHMVTYQNEFGFNCTNIVNI